MYIYVAYIRDAIPQSEETRGITTARYRRLHLHFKYDLSLHREYETKNRPLTTIRRRFLISLYFVDRNRDSFTASSSAPPIKSADLPIQT